MNQIIELANELGLKEATLSPEEEEKIEDIMLIRMMDEALAEGLADREVVRKKLGLI